MRYCPHKIRVPETPNVCYALIGTRPSLLCPFPLLAGGQPFNYAERLVSDLTANGVSCIAVAVKEGIRFVLTHERLEDRIGAQCNC